MNESHTDALPANSTLTVPFLNLLLVILIEGFITISVEILTIRQLIPKIGNSVVVTSLIIGAFLLFLAIGYQRGGTYRSHFETTLKNNFTLAAVILGIGLSYPFIGALFGILQRSHQMHPLLALSLYLLLVTCPLVYILGQTIPITMNLFRKQLHVGALGGRVLSLSTVGSFLGAVLTSLILMNYLGVAWTVFVNYLLLVLLTLLLLRNTRWDWVYLLILIPFGFLCYHINVTYERTIYVHTNSYNSYQILSFFDRYKRLQGKLFMVNDAYSSYLSAQNKGASYVELIKRVLFTDLHLKNKNILVLGAGGFTLSAAGTHGNRITYVDIDKHIKAVATQHFIPVIHGKFIASDARYLLQTSKKHYDAIVSDTYSNRYGIPFHLVTKEYFQQIQQHIVHGGYAIFNIIAKPTLDDAYSKRIDNTIRSVFKSCMVIPISAYDIHYSDQYANIVYVCKRSSQSADQTIYRDDLNKATLDYLRMKP